MRSNTACYRDGIPEEELLTAVILQAIADAGHTSHGEPTQEAIEAHEFLTSETGSWAKSRRDFCGAIGVDPDLLRVQILKAIPRPGERVTTEPVAPLEKPVEKPKPLRLRVLDALADGYEAVSAIAARINANQSSVVYHLKMLQSEGLVRCASPSFKREPARWVLAGSSPAPSGGRSHPQRAEQPSLHQG